MRKDIYAGIGKDGMFLVKAAYNEAFITAAKQRGGEWRNPYWAFPGDDAELARGIVLSHYHWDGKRNPHVICEMDITRGTCGDDSIVVGPIQVARKRFRDSAPSLADGVVVVSGAFLSRGGSAKSPEITYDEDTTVRIKEVPLSVAEWAVGEYGDSFRIVSEPISDAPQPADAPARKEFSESDLAVLQANYSMWKDSKNNETAIEIFIGLCADRLGLL